MYRLGLDVYKRQVLGLTPVIGIPLPFFSYGGSSLWGFTTVSYTHLASRATVLEAWKDALAGDPVSAFGGVLITNGVIDLSLIHISCNLRSSI